MIVFVWWNRIFSNATIVRKFLAYKKILSISHRKTQDETKQKKKKFAEEFMKMKVKLQQFGLIRALIHLFYHFCKGKYFRFI